MLSASVDQSIVWPTATIDHSITIHVSLTTPESLCNRSLNSQCHFEIHVHVHVVQ